MKPLEKFDNTDKAKLLHELFPTEIPLLLDNILNVCADFQENKEAYAKDWDNGFMPFDYWLNLSEQTKDLIKKHRASMIKSSRVFSEQFCFSYAVIFVNDRIIKYADNKSNSHKFKLAVNMLFKP